jgi:hypothetical protein
VSVDQPIDERDQARREALEHANRRQEAIASTRPHVAPCACERCAEWAYHVVHGTRANMVHP